MAAINRKVKTFTTSIAVISHIFTDPEADFEISSFSKYDKNESYSRKNKSPLGVTIPSMTMEQLKTAPSKWLSTFLDVGEGTKALFERNFESFVGVNADGDKFTELLERNLDGVTTFSGIFIGSKDLSSKITLQI